MLKAIGFLTADGAPTQRYLDYRDESRSRGVMAQALRDAYSDLFVINEKPSKNDRKAIEGKFKSVHNAKDGPATLMAGTFLALLDLADLSAPDIVAAKKIIEPAPVEPNIVSEAEKIAPVMTPEKGTVSLNYNIQIHLPATTDIEVYNAIFKSIRGHLID